jgi:hypothetical protein
MQRPANFLLLQTLRPPPSVIAPRCSGRTEYGQTATPGIRSRRYRRYALVIVAAIYGGLL